MNRVQFYYHLHEDYLYLDNFLLKENYHFDCRNVSKKSKNGIWIFDRIDVVELSDQISKQDRMRLIAGIG